MKKLLLIIILFAFGVSLASEKRYKCDECNKKFKSPSALIKHERTHTGERPFKCTFEGCQQAFTQKHHLTDHKRIHTGEKQYKCEECGTAFTRKGVLKIHERIHTGERPYKCDFKQCKETFAFLSALTTHKRIHTGEKPDHPKQKCDYEGCNYSSSHSGMLNRHKKIHTAEKPHNCVECDQEFSRSSHLKEHAKIHTDKYRHKCEFCNSSFKLKKSLTIHKKKTHKNVAEQAISTAIVLKRQRRSNKLNEQYNVAAFSFGQEEITQSQSIQQDTSENEVILEGQELMQEEQDDLNGPVTAAQAAAMAPFLN